MMLNSRRLLFTVLGCGLVWMPATGIESQLQAQQSDTASATDQQPAAPAGAQGQEADPLNRQLSDKERYKAQRELRQELKGPTRRG